jgi:enterobactin synthetase component F
MYFQETSGATFAHNQSVPPRRNELPLSAAQSGIWYAIKAGTSATAYNIAEYTRILGPIDIKLFEAALRQIVSDAEALRLRFFERDGTPGQIVGERLDWQLSYVDLSRHTDPMRAAETWMQEEVAQPLDLNYGPLFAFALFKMSANEFLWYFKVHHLIMDGYGAALITRRLAKIYTALADGLHIGTEQMGALRTLIDEDLAYRESANFMSDRESWQSMLSDCPEPPSLTVGGAPLSERILHRTEEISPATVARIQDFTRRTSLTFPQVITLAAVIFIHRLTNAEDLVLGQSMMARMSPIGRSTPAMATNIIPLRFNIHSDMRLETLSDQVRRKTRAALRRQRYRIADIRRDLRRVDRPIVRQICSVRPLEASPQFAGARSTNHPVRNGPVEDINIHVVYDGSGHGACRLEFEANPALYSADELERLQRRYLQLLSVLDDPDELVGRLEILPLEEREFLLERWNQTDAEYPAKSRVNELIETQSRRAPDRVAATFGERQLTYRQLDEQAARVARHLSALGVTAGDLVALHVERSLEMLVGLVGILKSGGAYVPLDPSYPRERLEFILADCRPRVVVTERKLRDQLRKADAAELLIDELPPEPSGVAPTPQAGDLAYVIYTSGSTGQPKGVQIPHKALVNFLWAMRREPGVTPDDRLLAVTSLSFDIAALELLLPLICGAEVIVAPADVVSDGRLLAGLVRSSRATIMQATPATWRILLSYGWEGSEKLKILCGGEAWPPELASALLQRCSTLWNMYGPTETTVWSAAARIGAGQPVLIGPPIANTTFYVLDPNGQIVPLGVPGELHIGGDGVAYGYHHRPDLTAERFVPDSFRAATGRRLYRTGDRVRQLPSGRLEFLGRLDHQVKIRGFRVELGEIETVLRSHSSVREAIALAVEDSQGHQRLAAFVTPEGEGVPIDWLKDLVRQRLPPYMMPAAIVCLREFPLTPNGKIDRKSLALRDDWTHRTPNGVPVAPRTPLEALVAELWCKRLHVSQIGVHDNFFDLGGDSLSIVGLTLEIERATGVSVPANWVYEAPTVCEMARLMTSQKPKAGYFPLVLLRPGVGTPLFMIPSMFGSVAELMPIARALPGDLPVYGVQARGLNEEEPPDDRVETMAERYADAIMRLQPEGPYSVVGKCFGGLVALETARCLLGRGQDIRLLGGLDTFLHPRFWPLRLRIAYSAPRFAKYAMTSLSAKRFRNLAVRIDTAARMISEMAQGDLSMTPPETLPPAAKAVFQAGVAAQAEYKPRYYPGEVSFLMCGYHGFMPNVGLEKVGWRVRRTISPGGMPQTRIETRRLCRFLDL